jgi:hypothetical protein
MRFEIKEACPKALESPGVMEGKAFHLPVV